MPRQRLHDPELSGVPFVEWDAFRERFAGEWQQGEHVALIGPTGQGKTTVGLHLLPIRRYVVVLATKPGDATLDGLRRRGWKITRRWPPATSSNRWVLWPRMRDYRKDVAVQRETFRDALAELYRAGGWCVFADDLSYLVEELGLADAFRLLWQHGRSVDLSLMVAAQRPARIPLAAYDQSTHLFFWRDNDEVNLKRIGGLGGIDRVVIRDAVARLPKHAVLYVNTRTGELARTKPTPLPPPTPRARTWWGGIRE